MKRVTLFILLLGTIPTLKAAIGVSAGYSYTNIRNSNSEGGEGYILGMSLSFSRFDIELNYCTKNATIRNVDVVTQDRELYAYDIDIKTGYLEIPILYNFYQLKMNNAKISCYAGLAVSIGSTDRSRLSNKRSLGKLPPEVRDTDSYYQWSYDKGGLPYVWGNSTTGFRIGVKYGFEKLTIGLRYNYEFYGGISAVNDITMNNEKFSSFDLYIAASF